LSFAGGESLFPKETFFSYDWSEPSCRMQNLIEKERAKKLREYYYARGLSDLNERMLSSALFVSIYTDYSLINSPLVSITNVWTVDEEFIELFNEKPEDLFLEFDGKSFWWRERLTRFPNRVLFFLDELKKELITVHKVFYSDYCQGEVDTLLNWSTFLDSNKPTVEELINFLQGD